MRQNSTDNRFQNLIYCESWFGIIGFSSCWCFSSVNNTEISVSVISVFTHFGRPLIFWPDLYRRRPLIEIYLFIQDQKFISYVIFFTTLTANRSFSYLGKQCFFVLRQQQFTVQCIAYVSEDVSKQMIKFISQ